MELFLQFKKQLDEYEVFFPNDQSFQSFLMKQTNRLDELIQIIKGILLTKGYIYEKHKLLLSCSSNNLIRYEIITCINMSLFDLLTSKLHLEENEMLILQIEPKLFITKKNHQVILSNYNRENNATEMTSVLMTSPLHLLLQEILICFYNGRQFKNCYYSTANKTSENFNSIKHQSVNFLFPFISEQEITFLLEFNEELINKFSYADNNEIQYVSVDKLNQHYQLLTNNNQNKAINIIIGESKAEDRAITNDNTTLFIQKSIEKTISITFTNLKNMSLFQFNSQMFTSTQSLELKFHFESIHERINYKYVEQMLVDIRQYLSSNIDLRLEFKSTFDDNQINTFTEIHNDKPFFNLKSLILYDSLCILSSTTHLQNLNNFISVFPLRKEFKLSIKGFKFNSNYNLHLLLNMINLHQITHFSMKNTYIEILDNPTHELKTLFEFDFNYNVYMRLNNSINETLIQLNSLKSFKLINTPLIHINVNNKNNPMKSNLIQKIIINAESILNKEKIIIQSISFTKNMESNKLGIECKVTDSIITQLENDTIIPPDCVTSLSFCYSDLGYKYMPKIKNAFDKIELISFDTCNSLFVSNILTQLYQYSYFPHSLKFKNINDDSIILYQIMYLMIDKQYLKIKDSFIYCPDLSVNYLSLTFYSIKELADIEGIDYDTYEKSIGTLVKQAKKVIKLKGNGFNLLYKYIKSNENKPMLIIKNTKIDSIDELNGVIDYVSQMILLNVSNIPLSFLQNKKIEIDSLTLNYFLFNEAAAFCDYYDLKAKMFSLEKDTKELKEKKDSLIAMHKVVKENVLKIIASLSKYKNKVVVYYYNQKEYASIINIITELTQDESDHSSLKENRSINQDSNNTNDISMLIDKEKTPIVNWSCFISYNQRELFDSKYWIILKKINKKNKYKYNN